MKKRYKIENWTVFADGLVGRCPEHSCKDHYRNERPEDLNKEILTSPIIYFDNCSYTVETQNSLYELGKPLSNESWVMLLSLCESKNIPVQTPTYNPKKFDLEKNLQKVPQEHDVWIRIEDKKEFEILCVGALSKKNITDRSPEVRNIVVRPRHENSSSYIFTEDEFYKTFSPKNFLQDIRDLLETLAKHHQGYHSDLGSKIRQNIKKLDALL